MKKLYLKMLPGAALALTFALAGCGSNMNSDAKKTGGADDTLANASAVGVTNCITCHNGDPANLTSFYFANSPHANQGTHVENIPECTKCHDPTGDTANVFAAFGQNQPGTLFMGCEACHGGGQFHWGVGPIPFPAPGPDQCGGSGQDRCHTTRLPEGAHQTYHPEANNIAADVKNSAHFTAEELHNSDLCVKCHNHEGAKRYAYITTTAELKSDAKALPSATNITCATCHDPHGDALLKAETYSSGTTVSASAEYNTCTNCHQAYDTDIAAGTYVAYISPTTATTDGGLINGDGDTTLLYHSKRWGRIIATTHWDNPATDDIEGFAMDTANERACRDCHNVHSADLTINEQWASSGHGGEIHEAKEAAAAAATDRTLAQAIAVQQAVATAWPIETEPDCQVCHTATGIKNFLTDPVAYDPVNNDFSYLIGTQHELLYCWGCHKNNAGGLRNPGSITVVDRNGDPFGTIPDIGNSDVCVKCHGGRAGSDYIHNLDPASRSASGRQHHAPAAGTLFSGTIVNGTALIKIGFEFDSMSYENVSYFAHNEIGLNADSPETGKGPCASCHMTGTGETGGHTFAVVVKDDTDAITAITSQELCNTCHTSHPMTPAILEEERLGYENAVALLGDYVMGPTVPTDGVSYVDNSLGLDFTVAANYQNPALDVNYYGTEQNWKYLDPDGGDAGAYAHNRYYAKRLIFDSIYWLMNASLPTNTVDNYDNETIFIPAEYPEARAYLGADADGNAKRPGGAVAVGPT